MNIIAWIILGLLAGAIAKWIFPGRQGGGFLVRIQVLEGMREREVGSIRA